MPGEYLPVWPVIVVGVEPSILTFTVAVEDQRVLGPDLASALAAEPEVRRQYAARLVHQRLHQASFRERVIRAYQGRCAVCRLHQRELLDAAHILPDWHPRGHPVVPNGLALCRLHHSAFDRHILGVRPDLQIEIRPDVLRAPDGPDLVHGLQGFHGARLFVPRPEPLRPDPEFLEERYEPLHAGGVRPGSTVRRGGVETSAVQ